MHIFSVSLLPLTMLCSAVALGNHRQRNAARFQAAYQVVVDVSLMSSYEVGHFSTWSVMLPWVGTQAVLLGADTVGAELQRLRAQHLAAPSPVLPRHPGNALTSRPAPHVHPEAFR